jgi:hypothetical protein
VTKRTKGTCHDYILRFAFSALHFAFFAHSPPRPLAHSPPPVPPHSAHFPYCFSNRNSLNYSFPITTIERHSYEVIQCEGWDKSVG